MRISLSNYQLALLRLIERRGAIRWEEVVKYDLRPILGLVARGWVREYPDGLGLSAKGVEVWSMLRWVGCRVVKRPRTIERARKTIHRRAA